MDCDVISHWSVTEGLEQTKKSTRAQLYAQVINTMLFVFVLRYFVVPLVIFLC